MLDDSEEYVDLGVSARDRRVSQSALFDCTEGRYRESLVQQRLRDDASGRERLFWINVLQ